MNNPIHITLNGVENIGAIRLLDPPGAFCFTRTVCGSRLQLLAVVDLRRPNSGSLIQIDGIQIRLSISNQNEVIEIGTVFNATCLEAPVQKRSIVFDWEWTTLQLQAYERLRDSRPPAFNVAVSGNLYFPVVPGKRTDGGLHGAHLHRMRSAPISFFENARMDCSRESWVATLRNLRLSESVIVEIPLLPNPLNEWSAVFGAIADARNTFEAGGANGWKSCVDSVRFALEKWGEIEPVNTSEIQVNRQQRKEQTKEQRAEDLRWSLLQYAHEGPHSHAEGWTRDDALLALSTLCALIAARRP